MLKTKKSKDSSVNRPPVVTIMGHVDHGKTSLLSTIKNFDLTRKEFGGISQHIGAYQVSNPNGKLITFIDTPGHEAFTQMRARGAKVTDLVVLVIAANEGVKPQTKEALSHARAAGVPIIIAINKTDLPSADVEKVKKDLTEVGLVPEDWGGDTVTVEISAKTGHNIPELLEMIQLIAEMAELKTDTASPFLGIVIESKLDPKRGPTATVLVKNGILKTGDEVFSGSSGGKIKAMINDHGERISEAGPSTPVEILGLTSVPPAGAEITTGTVPADAQDAASKAKSASESPLIEYPEGVKVLNTILKTDVEGTLEAIKGGLSKIETEINKVNLVYSATGDISESDILLAEASHAAVYAFNVRVSQSVKDLAKTTGVTLKSFNIIYELLDDIEKTLQGLKGDKEEQIKGGEGEIIRLFTLPKSGNTIIGIRITAGTFKKGDRVNILRDNETTHTVRIKSMHEKAEEISKAAAGREVGLLVSPQGEFHTGDRLATAG